MPLPSCVDGPWRARVFSRSGQGGTCGHVSGLYARYKTARPDGNRGSRSDHGHGVALPQDGRQVCLDLSVDRQCHHACSPSQAFGLCRAWPLRPPPAWRGSPPGASSAHAMRAILLASATATSLRGLLASSLTSHGSCRACLQSMRVWYKFFLLILNYISQCDTESADRLHLALPEEM